MKKFYFTFGQSHTHVLNGKTVDKNIVIEITAKSGEVARRKMVKHFGEVWSMQYDDLPNMKYFPGGVVKL